MTSPTLTLCICTMNRPDDLRRCLQSVYAAQSPPEQVIVSDDSKDESPARAVVAEFPRTIYQTGPRRGLGPNRNACLRSAARSHVVFMDDDVVVMPEFFAAARRLIGDSQPKTILTGYEINHQSDPSGKKIVPHNADFWGFQRVPVKGEYRAIVINAAVFPRALFEEAQFDEQLRYGSEEVDMAQNAVTRGFRIVYSDDLAVHHYPSPINRDEYSRVRHASRLYATMKAYLHYERALPKAFAYLLLAPLQLIVSAARRGDGRGVRAALQMSTQAFQYLRADARKRKIAPSQ